MKKKKFDLVLAITALAALVLLGMAVRAAVLRTGSNYHPVAGMLPDHPIPDCLVSAVFLLFAAVACFAGGLHYGKYDEHEEKGEDSL